MLLGLLAADVMAVAWMLAAGDWLDRTTPLTSVVTLGGHHQVVLWLAACSFAVLLLVAVLSGGFEVANGTVRILAMLAAGASLVAVGGMISMAALVVGVVVLIALLGRAFIR